ncbi:MAG: hypothetical protein JXR40_14710 [Pontiellaceae bacterium]|nr:hypothetical protein [Pontiellaceae bacterium]
MNFELEGIKKQTIELQGKKYRPYRKALADLDRARAIYDQLGARLKQHIIRTGTAKSPVEIFDRARASRTPVSSFSLGSSESGFDASSSGDIAYQLKKSMLAKERLEEVLMSGDQAAIDAALKDLDEALNEALDAAK